MCFILVYSVIDSFLNLHIFGVLSRLDYFIADYNIFESPPLVPGACLVLSFVEHRDTLNPVLRATD